MDSTSDDWDWSFRAIHSLNIVIVGAGIAALTSAIGLKKAGHDVTILEQAREITDVGAGIQMAPNATRIMRRLGLLDQIMAKSNELQATSLRRWQDDRELGSVPMMPSVGQRYNAPLSVIHRGDFQIILMQALKDLGIPIRLGSRVVEVDPAFSARVKLASGEWVEGDVIICGDGVRSGIRKQMATTHGVKYESQPTGDAAYRILIPEEKLKENPKALKMLKTDVGMRWMGPGGHIMAYPIRNNAVYNMVLLHPAKPFQENDENWTSKGDKKEMVDFYKDWNATVRELLSYAPDGEVMEWSLNLHRPLPSWVENKCVLVGDACHAMLPYVAQGAAQAIEDAAVLTCALSLTDDVDLALQVYELVRKDRGELIQSSALETRRVLHLPDGPAQRERDEAFAASSKADARNPDLWVDRSWQDFMWGTDVMKDTVDTWDELVAKVEGQNKPLPAARSKSCIIL